jgi:ADP-heptose:LPS heptosyltransferase
MPLPAWKKVLVVDLGFLGDTVHSIPAIRALGQSYALVDVMTTPVGAELLGLVSEVNRSWIIPLRKPSPPPWRHLSTLLAIRAEKYDAAISFAGSDRNLFCTGWSGARDRVAHLTGRNSWPAHRRLTRTVSRRDREQPVFEQRLSVLRDLGWEGVNPGWAWEISPEDEVWAKSQVLFPFLHLSISAASSPLNEWPLDSWSDVLHQVWKISPQTRVVVTGSGSEREIARQADLLSLVQDERIQNFFEPLFMSRFAALLRASNLHVGLDSGVLHLATALGKPTVSLFRESVGRPGWAPRGADHQHIIRACECNALGEQKCSGGRALCLSQISSDEVARAVLAALTSTQSSG